MKTLKDEWYVVINSYKLTIPTYRVDQLCDN